MKYTLIVLLMAVNSIMAPAQKNNLFADIGIVPGFSITYNYSFFTHFGVGAGFQGYNFSPTRTNTDQFTPALYVDMRFYFHQRKKGYFFALIDLGIDFYKHNNDYYLLDNRLYYVDHDNGFYNGWGFGYFRRITKRDGGLYASLKIILNSYSPKEYGAVYKNEVTIEDSGALAFSIGFKF